MPPVEAAALEQGTCEEEGAAERCFYGLTLTPIPIPLSCWGGEEYKRLKPILGEGSGLKRGVVLMSEFVSYYPIVNELN